MKEKRPMNKWLKRLIIFLIVSVLIIFLGPIVFYLGSYILEGLEYLLGLFIWLLRFLANLLDFFHFTGIFGG